MFLTIIVFFIILGILILSHELGHFIFAKLSGVKVEEFGFGFPPRIIGFRKGETLYSLNLLPFGGFVKIFGEDDAKAETPRSFVSRPLYLRAVIISAGVFFNLIVAWLIFSLGFFVGTPTSISDSDQLNGVKAEVRILEVQEGTPAFLSGLQSGDMLIELKADSDSLSVSTIEAVRDFIEKHSGKAIEVTYRRDSKEATVSAIPSLDPSPGKGALGIAMGRFATVKKSWHQALWSGLATTQRITWLTAEGFFGFLKNAFSGRSEFLQVTGPVGIATIVNEASRFGFLYILQLMALLSINIAIINIVPFPGLDGGRLLFLVFEALKGSPLSERAVRFSHSVGFFILVFLMLVVTYFDILRRIHS